MVLLLNVIYVNISNNNQLLKAVKQNVKNILT